MKRVTKIVITVGTAISLGLAAAAVSAQPFGYGMGPGMMGGNGSGYAQGYGMGGGHMGGYGPGYGMGGGHMGGGYGPGYGMGPQAMFNAYSGNAEEGLAGLKTELGITAKQDPAWQAFARNAKQQNESRQAWFARMHEARGSGSAPEMLAQQTEFMKQRQTEMAANAAALKDLYATLTPEQKAIADQRFGGYGPGWTQGSRGGPRGYAR
ncbi:MAG: Spy/CpxP family protein refolding chaperone [Burkholderiales bacterium]|nr:Spy/CpxP family protein refolding chaperone [Burkholderiales bacterium]